MHTTTVGTLLQVKGTQVITALPTDSIYSCVLMMVENRIGGLLIIEHGEIVGMFTERDLMTKVIPEKLDTERTPVSDVMNPEVLCVEPDLTLEEAMSIFTEKRVRHLPLLQDHTLLGIVSIGDVTKWLSESHRQKVEEIDELVRYINGGYSV